MNYDVSESVEENLSEKEMRECFRRILCVKPLSTSLASSESSRVSPRLHYQKRQRKKSIQLDAHDVEFHRITRSQSSPFLDYKLSTLPSNESYPQESVVKSDKSRAFFADTEDAEKEQVDPAQPTLCEQAELIRSQSTESVSSLKGVESDGRPFSFSYPYSFAFSPIGNSDC